MRELVSKVESYRMVGQAKMQISEVGKGWGWGLEDPEEVLKGSDRFPALGAEANRSQTCVVFSMYHYLEVNARDLPPIFLSTTRRAGPQIHRRPQG